MKVVEEYDFRNAKAIINALHPSLIKEIKKIVSDKKFKLNLKGKQRQISSQIQDLFVNKDWEKEVGVATIRGLKYDLKKTGVPIPLEIEVGHERLVYADFFKFLADFSKSKIPAAIMVVTNDPLKFGHSWHNSLTSTKHKLEGVKENYLVPILVLAIDP